MPDPQTWAIRPTEDFLHPGWLHVPHGMRAEQCEQWVDTALEDLAPMVGVARWDGTPTTEDHLRSLLEYAVADEPTMDALLTFQVWPLWGPAVLTCRVCVVPSQAVPDWRDADGATVHLVHAAEIGPGIQVTTHTTLADGDDSIDLYGVDLVFDAGDFAVVFSLEQGVGAMIANALTGLAVLKDVVGVERPDGSGFTSNAPTTVVDEQPWELMGS